MTATTTKTKTKGDYIIEFARIYKNSRPQYFFLLLDKPQEWEFLRPYYLTTTSDHPRAGRILEMSCLFTDRVWSGRASHGYGYAYSADVYGTLIDLIRKLHGKRLSAAAMQELDAINTHEDRLTLSDATLQELAALNAAEFARRCEAGGKE